ncbi:MAG: hypothetical protein JRJ69_10435 [Deltaproteobacteria bacterium]|nr:hypothetical protein [Deltaproteobacteria bacterium]
MTETKKALTDILQEMLDLITKLKRTQYESHTEMITKISDKLDELSDTMIVAEDDVRRSTSSLETVILDLLDEVEN